MSLFYVVGAYEDYKFDVFPSHISPIIAEFHMGQYRRWAYRIETPYKITPTHAVGVFYDSIQKMFPYLTYSLVTPVELRQDSQVIAISKDRLIVEHRNYVLCIRIFIEAIKNMRNPWFIYRSFLSIKNSLN
ncbi:hypothetical protein E2566_07870 [Pectobacterium punjabense]|uniref:Uncharacterized protein n=1 Tax=Pectobacterium punjabense TaxID=2108399 RepID=A0ABX6L0N0_9GAMM|nr:hypothetical protein [Pectobacterium punjabense]MBS4432432.1 hypothetical protein [Pectobacterium punjabense]PTA63098.1 hypothetical protein C9I36_16355 [Pectobacterium punjabense]QJA19846.1 hypothetical protein E2566_07870 [Pectobacterium punjabense]